MLYRPMARNFAHAFPNNCFPRNFIAHGELRWMRQWNQIENMFGAASAELSANHFSSFALYELRNGQPSTE